MVENNKKTKRGSKSWKKKVGQGVSKCTPEHINKLKQAFAIDANITQACYYAEISTQTYYDWINKNPKLSDEFEMMRSKLPLKAKENVAVNIQAGDIPLSKWYLERKDKDYAETIKIEQDAKIDQSSTPEEDRLLAEEYHKKLKENRLRRSRDKSIKDGERKDE